MRRKSLVDTQSTLATILIGSLVALAATILYVDPESKTLDILTGALVASVSTVIGFYFGSSQSSRIKDEAMTKMAISSSDASVPLSAIEVKKAAIDAAALAAPAAAAIAAPPAADIAAPPVVNKAVPPVVKAEVAKAIAASEEVKKQLNKET